MFGFKIKAVTIGLAALAFGGTLSVGTAPARAQNYYEGYEYGPGRPLGIVGSRRNALGSVNPLPQYRGSYHPGYGRAYRSAPRQVYRGYPQARYGYRGDRRYGARYGNAYRPIRHYGPRQGYRPVGVYGPQYGYGPRYRYGYGGDPYYRRSSNGAAVAGLIGGLAIGATAANAARPVYNQRLAYGNCWLERRRTVNRNGTVRIRRVQVCG
jgi:hypothetical protein